MASTIHVVGCAFVAVGFWTLLGYLLIRRLAEPGLALPLAPIAGWAVHSVLALTIHTAFLLFTTKNIAILSAWSIFVAMAFGRFQSGFRLAPRTRTSGPTVPGWCYPLAALLACVCAAAVMPKLVGDIVVLSDPIFDHSKASLIDEMTRNGLPPGNPYIRGGSDRLAYYYLWHFSAAEGSRLMHVSGWEADAAMTFFSAFASLSAMMGLAVRLSGHASAAIWVVALAASSSTRVLLVAMFGEPGLDRWIQNPGGFAGWFFQSAWVPQHLASATCVLLAVYLMTRLAREARIATAIVLGLVIAAAFESSTWIGGAVFAIAAIVIAPALVLQTPRVARRRLIAALTIAALLSLIVAWPFVRDQLASSGQRQSAAPIAFHPFPIVGEAVAEPLRGWLDVPAFWLVLLPIEMTAIYLPGLFAIGRFVRARDEAALDRRSVVAFAALALVSLAVAGLLVSTLADNNDLAWRAALLAASTLIVFAAAGLASWIAERRRLATVLALVACALGLPEAVRLGEGNLRGQPSRGDARFARMPELWARVRDFTAPTERVANNPNALARMTPWPVNIGWSLLADRRSCYATWGLTGVYASLPTDRVRDIDRQFIRVFAGDATADDVRAFATTYDCAVVVVTPEDGAWTRDPFAAPGPYELVDANPQWRIYRRKKSDGR